MADRIYLVYQVTNRFDGKIYVGVHSTLNKNDRYMGSGVEIKEALKKEGRKSFVKEILFEFDTKEEMLSKEKELVTREFCMREDTYNRIEGGGTYVTVDMIPVKDGQGNCFLVYNNDPRWLNGDVVHINKGKITIQDVEGKSFNVDKNDPRYLSGELTSISKNKVVVKDNHGNIFRINKKDPRYISGELVHNCLGTKKKNKQIISQEHKDKISLANSIKQSGEKNSQFGTCWINKEGKNKKIDKEYINEWRELGWIKGRI